MKCPRCGAQVPSGAKSCGSCGSTFAAGQYCPHCGKVIPKGSQKCPQCGRAIPQPVHSASAQNGGDKKPLTKRWWFWVVCTLLVLGIIGNIGNAMSGRKSGTAPSTASPSPAAAATAGPSPAPTVEPTETPAPTPTSVPTPSQTPVPAPTLEPTPQPTEAPTPKPAPVTSTEEASSSEANTGRAIYITPTGKKYHYDGRCNGGTYTESTLDQALKLGLTPCKKCVQ